MVDSTSMAKRKPSGIGASSVLNSFHENTDPSLGNDNAMEGTYVTLIERSLQSHLLDNALFLAERYVAEFPVSRNAIYYLSLCHYRSGDFKECKHALDGAMVAPTTRNEDKKAAEMEHEMDYLLALSCYELKEYSRAEECLLRRARTAFRESQQSSNNNKGAGNAATAGTSLDDWIVKNMSSETCPIPKGAPGFAMLGKIFVQSNRKKRAVVFLKASLQLDPFLWTSMKALAELGELGDKINKVQFSSTPHHLAVPFSAVKNTEQKPLNTPAPILRSAAPLFTPHVGNRGVSENNAPISSSRGVGGLQNTAMQTPGLTPIQPATPQDATGGETSGLSFLVNHVSRGPGDTIELEPTDPQSPTPHRNQNVRPEDENCPDDNKMNTEDDTKDSKDDDVSKQKVKSSSNGPNAPKNGAEKILLVLETCATMYQHVCQYRCKEAVQTLCKLSKKQQESGWVLHQQGRAYLEMNEFASARRSFEQMLRLHPYRLDGLELLSIVYWHLKKEVELSRLAQQALDNNRLSAITWCVVGNCFSLQKDHETALVFFRRSLQIDPGFAYAHSLSGYEFMANEDFDKAVDCFRKALRANERHYNAWYGLGTIFHRKENYDLAEYHFQRAVQLHPTSSILLCNLGIAQCANGKAYQALDALSQANMLSPQNPQASFQRAMIYGTLHRPAEALAELLKVRDSAPREAAVHFAMGKVLKRLGRPQEAITSFLTAMDLDPKDSQIIKSAMDKVGEPDVGEETMSSAF